MLIILIWRIQKMAEVSLRRSPSKTRERKERRLSRFARDLKVNRYLWLMILPVLAFYVIFCYVPMYGVVIAFKDFSPMKGILGSSWAGLKYFQEFFFRVFACANSSVNVDNIICLFISLLPSFVPALLCAVLP